MIQAKALLPDFESFFERQDVPFLEACWRVLSEVLDSAKAGVPPPKFCPVFKKDTRITEQVVIDWDTQHTTVKVLMGRRTTIIHDQTLARNPITAIELIKVLSSHRASEGFKALIGKWIELLEEWGYKLYVEESRSKYPFPVILFDKSDSQIGAISLQECTQSFRPREATLN